MPDLAARLRTTFGEFRRRRVFRVAAVYLIVGWLLIQVAMRRSSRWASPRGRRGC